MHEALGLFSCSEGLNDERTETETIRYNRGGSFRGETPGYETIWESLQPLSIFLQLKLSLEEALHMGMLGLRCGYAILEQGVPPAALSTRSLQGFKISIWAWAWLKGPGAQMGF